MVSRVVSSGSERMRKGAVVAWFLMNWEKPQTFPVIAVGPGDWRSGFLRNVGRYLINYNPKDDEVNGQRSEKLRIHTRSWCLDYSIWILMFKHMKWGRTCARIVLRRVEDNGSVSCASVIPILGIQINFLEQNWNVINIWER